MQDPAAELPRIRLPKLCGKYLTDVMVTYAPRHAEQKVPHGSVRPRMELHRSAPSRAHGAGTSQDTRSACGPGRHLLCPKERLPLAAPAEGLPALEERLRLVQEVGRIDGT
jgi:hypothetical protein